MTTNYRKMLFYSDGCGGERQALERTCAVAARKGASVTVMAVVDEVSTNDPLLQHNINRIQKTIIAERQETLGMLISGAGDPAPGILIAPGKDYVEVVRAVRREKFDLLVKAVNPEDSVQEAIFGTSDLRLIRYSPCPVLVLKESKGHSRQKFVVAIDPHATAGEKNALNDVLLETAASLAQQEDAELHLLHVQEKLTGGSGDDGEISAIEEAYKKDAEARIRNLTSAYTDVHEHLLIGKPASVIASFIAENSVDLLIMGSVARSGVPGLLIGNTAERLLSRVDCSVLVVKPDGWESPIE